MHARTTLPAVLLVLAAATGGCSSDSNDKADSSACKTALQRNFEDAQTELAAGGEPETKDMPAECIGVDTATLKRYTGEITKEWLASDDADKAVTDAFQDAFGDGVPVPDVTESASTAPQISDDCRAWIKDELLDSSETIDATPGYNACGDLSSEQLDQAVDDVTNELIEQGATPGS